ncbi:MAG TPA: sigma-70 family RNA polymerase sigma factor [Verrucomicrobiae bacterium]|jgi:RNA polymerase sigma-70 factor (ECF subfamily)|nr:sigma-70 family RNA polymerase sigma factor [Verrucomicrobiae bacterium]
MDDPDFELVSKSRQGDRGAFGKLVSKYYEMIYAVSYGVLHNREAARDSAQDVFLKAYRDLAGFKGDSKFKTWLYRVAMNAAIDQARRLKPQISLDATDVSDEEGEAPVIIPDASAGPREEVSKGELRDLVRKAVQLLSPDHRAILVLREWQGLSYDEIAETLNIELGTVMSRIHYARKKLGEVLQKMGVNPREVMH